MNCPFVTRAPKPLGLHVNGNGVKLGLVRTPPDLLEQVSGLRVVEPDEGALLACGGEKSALVIQSEAGERGVVCFQSVCDRVLVLLVNVNMDPSLLLVRAG